MDVLLYGEFKPMDMRASLHDDNEQIDLCEKSWLGELTDRLAL
jgi:hypothetical protein